MKVGAIILRINAIYTYLLILKFSQGLTSLIYLTSTNMYRLINYVAFVNWLAIGLSVVALLYFRYTRPNMDRPIKVSGPVRQNYTHLVHFYCVSMLGATVISLGDPGHGLSSFLYCITDYWCVLCYRFGWASRSSMCYSPYFWLWSLYMPAQ